MLRWSSARDVVSRSAGKALTRWYVLAGAHRVRNTLLVFVGLMSGAAADAQKISRAEQASAELVFLGFQHTTSERLLAPNDNVWTEKVRHKNVAKLGVELPARKTPDFVDGAPVGTLLIGHNVVGGIVYCAPPSPMKVNKEAQCLRDLDGDGTFDAAQITDWRKGGEAMFSAYVRQLAPVSKGAYEILSEGSSPERNARVTFADFKSGLPRFQLWIDEHAFSKPIRCIPSGSGRCRVLGVTLRFAAEKSGMRVQVENVEQYRVFNPFKMTSSP